MSGECSTCGRCCMVLPIPVMGLSKHQLHYYRIRGLREDQGFFLIPHECQYLSTLSLVGAGGVVIQKTYKCDIHESNDRPVQCVTFHGQKRGRGGALYYVPPECTMRKKDDKENV